MMLTKRNVFWQGFAVGAASGAAAGLGLMASWNALSSALDRRVVTVEESLQIGCPVNEVFAAWCNLSELPRMTPMVKAVRQFGRRSHWIVELHGKRFEWGAELTQKIPNQSIGWKSIKGPGHSGRVTFSPLASDTLVHVVVNYVPPFSIFAPAIETLRDQLEGAVKRALRDFKASMENQDITSKGSADRSTGTLGGGSESAGYAQHGRFGGNEPAEYGRGSEPGPLPQPEEQK